MERLFAPGVLGKVAATPVSRPKPVRPVAAKTPEFWTIPGLCWNARVTTSFGDLPIQALRLRDQVRTSNGAFAQVAFVDKIQLEDDFLKGYPDAQPVMIQAGAMGRGRPKQEIRLSPHQRVGLSESGISPDFRMARDLMGRPGVMRRPENGLTYYLFHCGTPVTVMIEGVWVSVAP
jgi:Hint domain